MPSSVKEKAYQVVTLASENCEKLSHVRNLIGPINTGVHFILLVLINELAMYTMDFNALPFFYVVVLQKNVSCHTLQSPMSTALVCTGCRKNNCILIS